MIGSKLAPFALAAPDGAKEATLTVMAYVDGNICVPATRHRRCSGAMLADKRKRAICSTQSLLPRRQHPWLPSLTLQDLPPHLLQRLPRDTHISHDAN